LSNSRAIIGLICETIAIKNTRRSEKQEKRLQLGNIVRRIGQSDLDGITRRKRNIIKCNGMKMHEIPKSQGEMKRLQIRSTV